MKPSLALTLLFFSLLLQSCTAGKETETVYTPSTTFHLASPRCTVDSVLFLNSATLSMELDYPGVAIFYTEDGSAVTQDSRRYSGPVHIDASKTISARAFHPDFLPSETVALPLKKMSTAARNAQVGVRPEAHSSYPGKGPQSLIDGRKGSANFRNGNFWMGYQADTVEVSLAFDREQVIESITLSVLEDNGAWIFLPRCVEVFANGKLAGREEWPAPVAVGPAAMKFLEIPVKRTTTNNLQVKAINWKHIPDWHPGKGTPPWFFIDELLIN
ncbi:MAG: chitobiase/beta-hexosaminidase C-terminal domain-containing protein [Lewinellaceae bacterium]|nr:chitobiase/beta-hexosaminidase C-terminal domain-containing protein [Lewinellaceae bacterium]